MIRGKAAAGSSQRPGHMAHSGLGFPACGFPVIPQPAGDPLELQGSIKLNPDGERMLKRGVPHVVKELRGYGRVL